VTQSGSKVKIMIEYKNPYTSHKTLGHYKAPAGVHTIQKEKLGNVSDEYAVKLQTSVLTHSESQHCYNSCYLKSVGYVLGQCFFDSKELEDVDREAQNMAKVIREGPFEFGGSAFTTLPNVQGIEQIKNFLWHSRSHSNANKLLCIACSWDQHQTG
jgi:hypothetical protein